MPSDLPSQTSDLITSALQLSASERIALAEAMLESVDDFSNDHVSDSGRVWEQEIKRRVEEIDSGVVEAIPSADMWKRLGGRPKNGN